MALVYQTTPRPTQKPSRAQRRIDREREMRAQADRLYSDLFSAMANGNRAFAHRVLDKMVDLRGEYLDIIVTAQTEAGEESQALGYDAVA